jgi:putative endonuclease
MYYVYILFSESSGKTYVGYTSDLSRRLSEHNITEKKGFTLKYRPWKLIYSEMFEEKKEASSKEKYFKTGKGRDEIKKIVNRYKEFGEVSAAVEKD